MKYLASIAFVVLALPAFAQSEPKFDCTTDSSTWTREQTFYCLARDLEELERLIREMQGEGK